MAYPAAEANIMEGHADMIEAIAKARDLAWSNQELFEILSSALAKANRMAIGHLVDDGLLIGADLCGTIDRILGRVESCGRDETLLFVQLEGDHRHHYVRDIINADYYFRRAGVTIEHDVAAADLLRWHAAHSAPGEIAIPSGAHPAPHLTIVPPAAA